MFLEIQLQAAFADGDLHPNEREVLFVIADELASPAPQFEQFLRMMQGGAQFGGGRSSNLIWPAATRRQRLAGSSAGPLWKMPATCWGKTD